MGFIDYPFCFCFFFRVYFSCSHDTNHLLDVVEGDASRWPQIESYGKYGTQNRNDWCQLVDVTSVFKMSLRARKLSRAYFSNFFFCIIIILFFVFLFVLFVVPARGPGWRRLLCVCVCSSNEIKVMAPSLQTEYRMRSYWPNEEWPFPFAFFVLSSIERMYRTDRYGSYSSDWMNHLVWPC